MGRILLHAMWDGNVGRGVIIFDKDMNWYYNGNYLHFTKWDILKIIIY